MEIKSLESVIRKFGGDVPLSFLSKAKREELSRIDDRYKGIRGKEEMFGNSIRKGVVIDGKTYVCLTIGSEKFFVPQKEYYGMKRAADRQYGVILRRNNQEKLSREEFGVDNIRPLRKERARCSSGEIGVDCYNRSIEAEEKRGDY